jgi:hypothetical protein
MRCLENGRFNLFGMRKDQCPECLGYNTATEQYQSGAIYYIHLCNDCAHEWSEGYG